MNQMLYRIRHGKKLNSDGTIVLETIYSKMKINRM